MRCCECCSLSGRSSRKTPSSHLKAEAFTDFSGTSPTLANENDHMVCLVWSLSSPVHKFRMCRCSLTQAPHPHGVGSPASVALVRRTPVIQVLQVIHNLQENSTWSHSNIELMRSTINQTQEEIHNLCMLSEKELTKRLYLIFGDDTALWEMYWLGKKMVVCWNTKLSKRFSAQHKRTV